MNYRELYEKHAKAEKSRAIAAIIGGTLSIVTGIIRLKQLKDERQAGNA